MSDAPVDRYGPEAVAAAVADGCQLEEACRFDPATNEYVYDVICVATDHRHRDECPTEHELFRVPSLAHTQGSAS